MTLLTIRAKEFLEALQRVDYKPYLFDIDAIYQLIRMGRITLQRLRL